MIEINQFPRQQRCLASPCAPCAAGLQAGASPRTWVFGNNGTENRQASAFPSIGSPGCRKGRGTAGHGFRERNRIAAQQIDVLEAQG